MAPPSPPSGCPLPCPGCAHRHLPLEESRARKLRFLTDRLGRWRHLLEEVRTTPQRWAYRDRSLLSARYLEGHWRFGLLRRDELVPIPDCPVHTPRVNQLLARLAPHLPPALPLAFVAINAAQVVLVVKAQQAPTEWCTPQLTQALAAAGGEALWLHLFPAAGVHPFAKNGWQLLWGEPHSYDTDGLRYGPTAFRQLIPSLYDEALTEATRFLAPASGDAVVDLYCGSGSSLRRWLARDAQCIGIEVGAEALACAAENAPGATLLRGTCAHRLPQLRSWLAPQQGRRLLYLNPPRTGLEPAVATWAAQAAGVERIAYLSCSPATLARDLDLLERGGFQLERLIPFDFFPQTYHVETLALLRLTPPA